MIENSTTTLLSEIQKLYPDSSKRTHLIWIKHGRVLVNDRVIRKPNFILTSKEKVTLLPKEKVIPGKISILYEDPYFLVINKPSGLLSVPKDVKKEMSVFQFLKNSFSNAGILPVHRLDKETSGLMLFAKGKKSQEAFKELFAAHDLTREYFAILEGALEEKEGTWKNYLYETASLDVKITDASDPEGKEAITHFRLIHQTKAYSYVLFQLETGKKHQIRIQASHIGHPVLGDKRYHSTQNPLHRICLHSRKIVFVHPFTKKPLLFTSPLPEEFYRLDPKAEKFLSSINK